MGKDWARIQGLVKAKLILKEFGYSSLVLPHKKQ
jgi:hypothetical protein